jgi:hypothetical protein
LKLVGDEMDESLLNEGADVALVENVAGVFVSVCFCGDDCVFDVWM